MASDSNTLLKSEDFCSAQIIGRMFNSTSKSALRKGKPARKNPEAVKIQQSVRDNDLEDNTLPCELIEFQEAGLTIEVPALSCATGHDLKLDFEIRNLNETTHFRCSVRVTEVEKLTDDRQKVTARFTLYDPKDWEKFCEFFAEKQQKLLELFHSIRGY